MINYKTDRCDMGYLPSDGETLRAYSIRIQSIAQTNRYSFSPPHEQWWSHRNPAPCYICNFMDMLDYLVSIIQDIESNDKRNSWKCVRPEGNPDVMSFSFQPTKK